MYNNYNKDLQRYTIRYYIADGCLLYKKKNRNLIGFKRRDNK